MPASNLSARHTRTGLDCLPNEILETIMSFFCGVTTLYAFAKAHTRAQALFERSPNAFLINAIQSSSMHLHLQKILCSIISIHQLQKGQVADKDFRNFVHKNLSDQSERTPLKLNGIQPTESIGILAHAANLCDFVTEAERSFLKVRLPKVADKIQLVVARDRFFDKDERPLTLNYTYQHPSETEVHRIRRALWRVCLYLEAFYIPNILQSDNELERVILEELDAVENQTKPTEISPLWYATSEAKHLDPQECFFQQMTVWELQEMDCLWNHLSHQYTTFWHQTFPYCHRSLLSNDLISHLRERRHHLNHESRPSDYDWTFDHAYEWFRVDLELGMLGRTTALDTAAWLGSLARESSGGFLYHLEYHGLFPDEGPPRVICSGRRCGFIDWACCMWDQDRIAPLALFG